MLSFTACFPLSVPIIEAFYDMYNDVVTVIQEIQKKRASSKFISEANTSSFTSDGGGNISAVKVWRVLQ